ncbi:cyclin-dependent protein kinase inhibitor SMR2 [Cucumis melo var. makuwa]|uniref:Cyclin-dependent protein kinase inhibitor SMR2 n=2 Tax=Cucumis melo TaxID=3656 RepID=A0A5D3BHE9_CUCMM|nr:cyclin-dependent protein kinase inhibitor SMR2 [Cucumis melo var. makuwa]TYJ98071.1 cyclin-dependent protein kinase inhibitor SMR2 [Cucumis melo var. makuwa]
MSQIHKSDQEKVLETPKALEYGDRSTEEGSGEALKAAEDDEGESCRTPTSLRHRIPIAQSCPTTPRKQRVARKRKISDQSFFEATGRGEVESLFGLFYRVSSSKRRCTSV